MTTSSKLEKKQISQEWEGRRWEELAREWVGREACQPREGGREEMWQVGHIQASFPRPNDPNSINRSRIIYLPLFKKKLQGRLEPLLGQGQDLLQGGSLIHQSCAGYSPDQTAFLFEFRTAL